MATAEGEHFVWSDLSFFGALAYAVTFLAFAVKHEERRVYIAKASELLRARRRVPAAA